MRHTSCEMLQHRLSITSVINTRDANKLRDYRWGDEKPNMSYTSFSGDLVLWALSHDEVFFVLSDLVGCSIDDGVSEDAWVIDALSAESRTLTISNGSRTRTYPLQSLTNGNLEVPQARQELIEILEDFRETNQPRETHTNTINAPASLVQDNKSQIKNFIVSKNIQSLFHFTRLENVKSILENGLVPRHPAPPFPILSTDEERFDRRLDCVCLSISFPNYKMFYQIRKNRFPSSTWCVLSLKPDILFDLPCLFFSQNAARYGHIYDRRDWRSASALENLYQTETRPNQLPSAFPTDVQAEVQVEKAIPSSMILRLDFEDDSAANTFLSMGIKMQDHIEVCKHPGLFSERDYYLKNLWEQENH